MDTSVFMTVVSIFLWL